MTNLLYKVLEVQDSTCCWYRPKLQCGILCYRQYWCRGSHSSPFHINTLVYSFCSLMGYPLIFVNTILPPIEAEERRICVLPLLITSKLQSHVTSKKMPPYIIYICLCHLYKPIMLVCSTTLLPQSPPPSFSHRLIPQSSIYNIVKLPQDYQISTLEGRKVSCSQRGKEGKKG